MYVSLKNQMNNLNKKYANVTKTQLISNKVHTPKILELYEGTHEVVVLRVIKVPLYKGDYCTAFITCQWM